MLSHGWDSVERAARVVRERTATRPEIAIVLGSGLGALANEIVDGRSIPYADIPEFPRSTAPGHAGRMIVGSLEGRQVVAMAGRVHLYEGYSASEVVFGVRVMAELGAHTLVITNAAGGVNQTFQPGLLMLITDHINLTGHNPLVGPNNASRGTRFPDMSEVYSRRLRTSASEAAAAAGVALAEGVYLGLLGPSYETPAEIRMARELGADAVGMSTVMESIAAHHLGVEILGISCITNMAAGILPQRLTEEEVLETATRVQNEFVRLVRGMLARIGWKEKMGVQDP